ncbi:MAG: hypothetical protein ACUZ8H_12345 [Candidatus Anammoxibacter sp.]
MEIGSLSSNTFIQQISGNVTNKQLQNTNPTDDANVTATLESSQNIGEDSVRKIEQGSGADSGPTVSDNNDEPKTEDETGALLDVLA